MNITFLYIFSPVNDLPQNSLEWSFGLFQIEFIIIFFFFYLIQVIYSQLQNKFQCIKKGLTLNHKTDNR